MSRQPQVHPQLRVIAKFSATRLETCLEMFMLHQEASQHTERTLGFYEHTFRGFLSFLTEKGITTPEDIQPHHIREFIVYKQRQHCKDTTVPSYARAIKTFCKFLTSEGLLSRNPMRSVTTPKLAKKIRPPFSREDIEKLLEAWQGPLALRDRAIILCLLDSGLRASEFLSLNVGRCPVQRCWAASPIRLNRHRNWRVNSGNCLRPKEWTGCWTSGVFSLTSA